MAALTGKDGAIGILKLDGVMIEDFAIVGSARFLRAAQAMRPDGMPLLHPIDDIDIMNVLFDNVVAAQHILKLDGVMIEDFAIVGSARFLRAAQAMRPDGMPLLHPIDDIDIMNVLFDNVVAAQPRKIIPIIHLELHLVLVRLARMLPGAVAVPVAAHGHDVTDRAVVQPLHGLQITRLMVPLQSHADLQTLFL